MPEELKEMLESVLKDDEGLDLIAKIMAKLKDKLTERGFSREEAVQIIAGQGVGVSSK